MSGDILLYLRKWVEEDSPNSVQGGRIDVFLIFIRGEQYTR